MLDAGLKNEGREVPEWKCQHRQPNGVDQAQFSLVLFGVHWIVMLEASNNFGTTLNCRFNNSHGLNKIK